MAYEALPDDVTVGIDEDTDYEPDAVLDRGAPLPPDAIAATKQALDTGDKLADYFRLPSIHHSLPVRTRRREVIHHARLGEWIETRILTEGALTLDPPGLAVQVAEFHANLTL